MALQTMLLCRRPHNVMRHFFTYDKQPMPACLAAVEHDSKKCSLLIYSWCVGCWWTVALALL